VLFAVATPASPQQVEWKDPSPHTYRDISYQRPDSTACAEGVVSRIQPSLCDRGHDDATDNEPPQNLLRLMHLTACRSLNPIDCTRPKQCPDDNS
jgi:hypothetical protein